MYNVPYDFCTCSNFKVIEELVMENLAPNHVCEFCTKGYNNSHFEKLGKKHNDKFTPTYQIQCKCGCFSFEIFTDEHPTVNVKCKSCGKEITVYELSNYPAACKLPDELIQTKFQDKNFTVFEVCVLYEYSSDYENNDDISWCIVWLYNPENAKLIELINDETA
jgi:hypothetical protein